MSPHEVRRTNQWDAFLSACGIGALTFLAATVDGYKPEYVIAAIAVLSVRSTALLIHAAKVVKKGMDNDSA